MNLYDKLLKYRVSDYYPMHMPGHKRNKDLLTMVNPYSIDITEIDGFDNLHHAEEVLLQGMERAADLYKSHFTGYLVGGSTAGILTGISACTKKGDKILVARNSHKSVYHGIYLNELEPVYIYPQTEPQFGISGGIFPEKVEEMLIKHPDIKLVVLTSPTYEGILSDIKSIADITHKYGVPLMVDEAHGAHLGFHPGFPKGSVGLGADIVIHSIHKTLPALTQSALIHVNGNLADVEEIKRYLAIYQSSSPSYLLMAGIEQCITLLKEKGEELFEEYYNQLTLFYNRMEGLKYLRILTGDRVKSNGYFAFDPSKIVISVKGLEKNGIDLYTCLLKQYHIQMEMVSKDYILGMTSIGDTREGFKRLGDALLEIDNQYKECRLQDNKNSDKKENEDESGNNSRNEKDLMLQKNTIEKSDNKQVGDYADNHVYPQRVMSSNDAYNRPREVILLSDSIGRITAEYINLYPPGIPLLVPGEKISKDIYLKIIGYQESGLSIQGLEDTGKCIKVIKNET
ncbi:aminotransferase class I/II-fold pyridoxal phosphate-dependent enzyme [Anaerocolumna sp. MB42-C2]|uniref:aminotransferase class I/II-fold pyridoxal phosphate-dependent enzyme n=1 Tax=Anaerocolumna sp. MB42-C2 TaxID=3070997 RepID=UPI0027E02B8D|nr:aminotransferase class I/II-fold pyridoxal phosphate-dependent enzyme [Anaerocolumna sp. MB42-C2]WMJ85375.1 aminotransferase class I/II-fold pyridoxal phosphate-dependent enzyme [Anaerocolumna sp. MB42-C2]